MPQVTVSPKFQVVIPESVRNQLGIQPGEKLEVISFDDRIELVRVPKPGELRGFLKGFDPTFQREKEDRL